MLERIRVTNMGDMADDYAYQQLCESMPYSEFNPRGYKTAENFVWTMRSGEKIKLSNMTSSHIKNCIRMLQHQLIPDVGWEMTGFEGGYTHNVLDDQNNKINDTIGILSRELANRKD